MSCKIDLHVHTIYSYDSLSRLRSILKAAGKKGLSGVAVTDHETMKGAFKLTELNKDKDFVVIKGMEVKTEIGDIIGLFLSREIESRQSSRVIREIKDQGGIVVLPHPFKGAIEINPDLISCIDVIEGLNSRIARELNGKAQIFAKEKQKPVVAGSDAHRVQDIGTAYTIFDGIEVNQLKKNILSGNCRIGGRLSPGYVHYFSFITGNVRKGTLLKAIYRRICKKRK